MSVAIVPIFFSFISTSSFLIRSNASCRPESFPSANRWRYTLFMFFCNAMSRSARICPKSACTEPEVNSPIIWTRELFFVALSKAPTNAGFWKKLPSAIERLMRVRYCWTIRPAPRLRCPTSLFPASPHASPTASPEACNSAIGYEFIIKLNVGVCPWRIALPNVLRLNPQPSRIVRMTGRRGDGGPPEGGGAGAGDTGVFFEKTEKKDIASIVTYKRYDLRLVQAVYGVICQKINNTIY